MGNASNTYPRKFFRTLASWPWLTGEPCRIRCHLLTRVLELVHELENVGLSVESVLGTLGQVMGRSLRNYGCTSLPRILGSNRFMHKLAGARIIMLRASQLDSSHKDPFKPSYGVGRVPVRGKRMASFQWFAGHTR